MDKCNDYEPKNNNNIIVKQNTDIVISNNFDINNCSNCSFMEKLSYNYFLCKKTNTSMVGDGSFNICSYYINKSIALQQTKKLGFIEKLFMTKEQKKELTFQSEIDNEVLKLETAISKLDLNVNQLKSVLDKTYSIKTNIENRIIKYNEIYNRYNLEAENFVKKSDDKNACRILKKQYIIETQISKYKSILQSYDDYINKVEDQKDDLEFKILEAKSNNELALLRKDIAMLKLSTTKTLEVLNNGFDSNNINEMIKDIEFKAIGQEEVEKLLNNDPHIDDIKIDSNVEDKLKSLKDKLRR